MRSGRASQGEATSTAKPSVRSESPTESVPMRGFAAVPASCSRRAHGFGEAARHDELRRKSYGLIPGQPPEARHQRIPEVGQRQHGRGQEQQPRNRVPRARLGDRTDVGTFHSEVLEDPGRATTQARPRASTS